MSSAMAQGRVNGIVSVAVVIVLGLVAMIATMAPAASATADAGRIGAGRVLRVSVPEAIGGKTVIGQLTVDNATEPGFVTAYGCGDGLPGVAGGGVARSDVNFDGRITPVASNRLIVQADGDGDICFYTSRRIDMIVDVNAVSFDVGINSFPNRRTDTRSDDRRPQVTAGDVLRVRLPDATGGRTVFGQLTADRTAAAGYVTAYGCDDGVPRDGNGRTTRSDLNVDGRIDPVASNRLIVQADQHGEICLFTSAPADVIVDVNAVSDIGITSFPNRRTDTRTGTTSSELPGSIAVPEWPPFDPAPPLDGVAALTGAPASVAVTRRPIVAVKIDNFRAARPQWGLDRADAVIEENVEGVTRFIALFHTHLPDHVGPVRSARTADLDLLAAMNRPIFGYSGANGGVSAWIASAARSAVLVDFSSQRAPCFVRTEERPGPHNLMVDTACAVAEVAAGDRRAGPAGPLWTVDASWTPPDTMTSTADTSFRVPMDGVRVEWTWNTATGTYLRSQDDLPHVSASGVRVAAHNVVEISSRHVPSPVDARSPNPITVGSGDAVVHRDGRAFAVTWSRPTPYEPFSFVHPGTGTSVPLDRGTTFIQLVRDR